MTKTYDDYYSTLNLFGDAYPELIAYFKQQNCKTNLLDLGCGQGRDAIALSQMGYEVRAVDCSKIGIEQLQDRANDLGLSIDAQVADIYAMQDFMGFDYILLDSMFHFYKNDIVKETELITKMVQNSNDDCKIIIAIQDGGKKVSILNGIFNLLGYLNIESKKFNYEFYDQASKHRSLSPYQLVICDKAL